MCEFCNNPAEFETNRDWFHSDFAGFFSADPIQAAVEQVAARRNNNDDDSSDSSKEDDDDDDI